ncbi:DNA replication factor Dna2-domain-containing protein [Hyaloraphidium curvatum]|nr:DNA replication factor Dna2-domain-containing protein [Hyaloraphidium curvatum]
MRKAVIDDRIKRAGDSNVAALFGTMMHEIIQTSLRAADYSDDFLSRETDRVVADKIEQLYFLGQSEDAATAHLAQLTQSYKEWAGTYLTDFPRPPIVKPAQTWKSKHTEAFSIWKVLDIEENIWSPMFGIKGKIDASVCIRVTKAPKLLADTFVAPLEIKAGGASNQASHLAQTMMYTLLMTDRYGFDVDSGVLYYAKSGDTTRVAKARNELRSIIMGRNEMASWLQSKKLPPMLQDVRKCQRCFAIDACTVYHKALEKGTDASSGLGLIFQDKTKDMTPLHDSFFKTWEQLINLEEGDALRYRREIWNLNSAERAKFGRCLPNMRLVGGETDRGKIVGAVSRYRCVFEVGSGASQASGSQQNLLQSQFVVGDPVVVSTEAGQYALGLGFVIEISTRRITLALDHPLTGNRGRAEHFSALDNQDIEGIAAFENVEGGTGKKLAGNAGGAEPVMYRIDKDEMQGAMGTLRNNLVQLFVSNGDHKRRELVVDLRAPRFLPNVDLDDMAPRELLDELNPDQREALKKVTSAVDYALILGMPGTGKTTTIATIIKALVGKGKSVFLTSHTHSAVDNVLIKLKESGVRFARIGNRDKARRRLKYEVENAYPLDRCIPRSWNTRPTTTAPSARLGTSGSFTNRSLSSARPAFQSHTASSPPGVSTTASSTKRRR